MTKDISDMFEPKLPRGINLYNVTPADVFQRMVAAGKNHVRYYVVIRCETYKCHVYSNGPYSLYYELQGDLDRYTRFYPPPEYSISVLTEEEFLEYENQYHNGDDSTGS